VTENTEGNRNADTREPLASDFIIPVLASGLAIYYIVTTNDLVWEARAAGLFVGVPLLVMCGFVIARTIYRIVKGEGSFSGGDLFANTPFNWQRLGLIVILAAFVWKIERTGTTLGLFLVLVASMWMLGVRSIKQLLLIAGTTCMVVYVLLMYLVGSRLPRGPVEWLIAWAFGLEA